MLPLGTMERMESGNKEFAVCPLNLNVFMVGLLALFRESLEGERGFGLNFYSCRVQSTSACSPATFSMCRPAG